MHLRQHCFDVKSNCDFDSITAPSSTPINIQIEQTENPGELFVSWLPPPKDTHNGIITGYHVKAVPQQGSPSESS